MGSDRGLLDFDRISMVIARTFMRIPKLCRREKESNSFTGSDLI